MGVKFSRRLLVFVNYLKTIVDDAMVTLTKMSYQTRARSRISTREEVWVVHTLEQFPPLPTPANTGNTISNQQG